MSYDPSITFFASFIPMFFSFASLIELAFYIIGSIGLYSMANNTGMKNPWLAWIPVAREYLLGSLADRYSCTSRQKKTSFAIWLTVASVIQLPVIGFILLSIPLISSMMYFSLPLLLVLFFLVLMVAVINLACKVLYLVCVYYTVMDYEPSRCVLYTILAFFNLEAIVWFLMRRNVPVGVAGRCEPLQPKYNVH